MTVADDDLTALKSHAKQPNRDHVAGVWPIFCGVSLLCIPMIVVSAVLIGIIAHYQIVPDPGMPEFRVAFWKLGPHNDITTDFNDIERVGDDAAYYVDYPPTSLTTIASWIGYIVPYLSSFIIAMTVLFIPRFTKMRFQHSNPNNSPVPEQQTTLDKLPGNHEFGSLKNGAAYYKLKNQEKLVTPGPAMFTALALITILGTDSSQSLLIALVNTWFGLSVQTATVTQLYQVSGDTYHSFGRQIDRSNGSSSACAQGPMIPASQGSNLQSFAWPCNIEIPVPYPSNMFLTGGQTRRTAQSGLPSELQSEHAILYRTGPATESISHSPSMQYPVYFIGDDRSSTNEDFEAWSMGIATQCEIITTKCYKGEENNGTAFKCPGGFEGDFTMCQAGTWPTGGSKSGQGDCTTGIGFAADAQLSRGAGFTNMTGKDHTSTDGQVSALLQQNPIYFGTWAQGFPAWDDLNTTFKTRGGKSSNDKTEVFAAGASVAMWLLNCSATIYDIDYTWVNGTLHNFRAEPAAPEWGAFFSAPYAWASLSSGLNTAKTNLQSAAWDAAYSAHNATDLANHWARAFSSYALSTSLGVFVPQTNILEQGRNNAVSVTRVPLVPLYLLLCLDWLYVVVVLCLVIGVSCFTHPTVKLGRPGPAQRWWSRRGAL
ncbi:hypothetical protein M406DRAFT_71036 [Cryphonectria parasitica EP155]|uniref:Uncharacterized protein n=1 Tax=Cryphonectria parasitica (strain ATCC 38755 / EP155) TaxID=660469 RepID=A0A9P5CNS4_CRYP1|nr:uncharacterized protein M406DRAFT_71036 [Cryphonectria parasitica EP155]KAF3764421.1 hypothetical protein M406DRAFT_71036 [Cryphonectria parasitica EP155]